MINSDFWNSFQVQSYVLGHLDQVCLITFDHTGTYVLTGSDEGKVPAKIICCENFDFAVKHFSLKIAIFGNFERVNKNLECSNWFIDNDIARSFR